MENGPLLPTGQENFALARQIDAICDRFEDAWSGGSPRIEDFLAELAEPGRATCFRELLVIELALGPPVDYLRAREAYEERFPEYREIVAELLAEASSNASTVAAKVRSARQADLIREAHGRLTERFTPAEAATLGGRTSVIEASHLDDPLRPAGELWNQLVRYARELPSTAAGSLVAIDLTERLVTVARTLLVAFPERRRAMLWSILGGATIDQTAVEHHTTQRTVKATCQMAARFLDRR